MDTLWTMAQSDDPALGRVGDVVLLSPDIEIDVFRKQAPAVLARGVDITIFVSSRDRALRAAAFVRGERERLGSIRDLSELGGLAVDVIDLSGVDAEDALGHFPVATAPALITYVRGLHAMGLGVLDTERPIGPLQAGAALVQQATNILLQPLLP